jgi:hypothetical protein
VLGFEFRLKTGFFETKLIDLLISKGKLMLSPSEAEDQVITISEKDILNITLKNVKSLEIEIQTWDKIYQGVFIDKADYEELLKKLKENINKKIVFEYEGGN